MFGFFRYLKIKKHKKNANRYLEQKFVIPTERESNNSVELFDLDTLDVENIEIKPNTRYIKYVRKYYKKVEKTYIETDCEFGDVQFCISDDVDRYDVNTITRRLRECSNAGNFSEMVKELEKNLNQSFVDKLLDYIDKKGIRDSDVYKAAQVDKRLFSKIASNREYKPSKDTAIALAYALKLSLDEVNDLLFRAGYTLSHSNKRDIIIEYFFRENLYDLIMINEILDNMGLKIIGR